MDTLTRQRLLEREPDRSLRVTVGVDLGQLRDPSAIVVAEAARRETGKTEEVRRYEDGSAWLAPVEETVFKVRHVERLPLRTPFRRIGQRVREVVEGLDRIAEAQEKRLRAYVLCDRTGMGLPATEEIREELGTAVPVSGVVITVGDKIDGTLGSRDVRAPKATLVTRLAALLQAALIELPASEEAGLLADEMKAFQVHQTVRGIRAEAESGMHDDLVTALALAILFDPFSRRMRATGFKLFR